MRTSADYPLGCQKICQVSIDRHIQFTYRHLQKFTAGADSNSRASSRSRVRKIRDTKDANTESKQYLYSRDAVSITGMHEKASGTLAIAGMPALGGMPATAGMPVTEVASETKGTQCTGGTPKTCKNILMT